MRGFLKQPEGGRRDSAMKYVGMSCMVNTVYKLPTDEGFLSDNATTKTVLLGEKIKYTPCMLHLVLCKTWTKTDDVSIRITGIYSLLTKQ